jgi:hypothetical protein
MADVLGIKYFFSPLPLRFHPFDERCSGAFETFAGNFLRGVNAQLAAANNFAHDCIRLLSLATILINQMPAQ